MVTECSIKEWGEGFCLEYNAVINCLHCVAEFWGEMAQPPQNGVKQCGSI